MCNELQAGGRIGQACFLPETTLTWKLYDNLGLAEENVSLDRVLWLIAWWRPGSITKGIVHHRNMGVAFFMIELLGQ